MAAAQSRLHEMWILAQRWKFRLFFALADQGLYSATNFLLTILYASWLPLDAFGRYVVIWTTSLFIEAIEISLIIDSLPAIVSRYGRRNRQRLDVAALWVVIGYGAGTSLLLIGIAAILLFLEPDYSGPILALAVVNPLQRIYLFIRRLCYIRDRQDIAALAAFAYGVLMLAGTFVLLRTGMLSLNAVILLSGLGASGAILVTLASGIGRLQSMRPRTTVWLAAQMWRSGRWLSAAAVANWISTWGAFPLIAALSSPGVTGIIRALQNLLTPVVQFNAALNLAILPRVADKVVDVGDQYARSFALRGTAIFAAIVIVYCAVIIATAGLILPAIYKKPEIAAASFLLWPLALALIFDGLRQASSMALVAIRRTQIVFIARFVSLVVFLTAGAVFGYVGGFEGILWATVAATATSAAIVMVAATVPISVT